MPHRSLISKIYNVVISLLYYPLASQMARKYHKILASVSSRLIAIQCPDKICLQESHPKQLPYLQSTTIKYLDWKLVTSCQD